MSMHSCMCCSAVPNLKQKANINQYMQPCINHFLFCPWYTSSIPLPSILGRWRRSRSTVASSRTKALKVVTWDRTIVCLPSCYPQYCKSGGGIALPRKKRSVLAANGLIGKIHLESDWSEDEVFAEIRSVFSDPMDGDASFPFKISTPDRIRHKIADHSIFVQFLQVDPKGGCWKGRQLHLYPCQEGPKE